MGRQTRFGLAASVSRAGRGQDSVHTAKLPSWLGAVVGAVLGLLEAVNPVATWAWALAITGVGLGLRRPCRGTSAWCSQL